MANRQRAEARRKAQAKASRSGGGGGAMGKLGIWVALAVVLVLGVGIAIFTSGDDSKASTPGAGSSDSPGGVSSLPDSQPVTVTGEPLVRLDEADSPDPSVGVVAPVLSGLNFNGEAITIDPAKDGPYMVVFLAHWCPHCNYEVPQLNTWKHSGAVPTELKVIGVATAASTGGEFYPPSSWFSNRGWEWPVMVDETQGDGVAGKAAVAYGASGWPYFVIVGADGKVKARADGEVEIADLQIIVDNALAA